MPAIAAHHQPDRNFKYWIIAPAVFLLLLMGLFSSLFVLTLLRDALSLLPWAASFWWPLPDWLVPASAAAVPALAAALTSMPQLTSLGLERYQKARIAKQSEALRRFT